jgi:hypothetical protein
VAHITETDKWPSFGEELGRKALTTLEKWMQRYDDGKINKRELYVLVDGLYDTVSGLAPRDDCAVIEAVHLEIRSGKL